MYCIPTLYVCCMFAWCLKFTACASRCLLPKSSQSHLVMPAVGCGIDMRSVRVECSTSFLQVMCFPSSHLNLIKNSTKGSKRLKAVYDVVDIDITMDSYEDWPYDLTQVRDAGSRVQNVMSAVARLDYVHLPICNLHTPASHQPQMMSKWMRMVQLGTLCHYVVPDFGLPALECLALPLPWNVLLCVNIVPLLCARMHDLKNLRVLNFPVLLL